jgi:uncharacterized protein DUF6529
LQRARRVRLDWRMAVAPPAPAERRPPRWLAAPIVVFALVALTAGLLAREAGGPRGRYFDLFFSDTIHMKAWLASAALAFGVFQLFSAAWIYRKLPWPKPRWINAAHRWSGRLAFGLTLPVAYHCIFQLGFVTASDRVLAHSLLGSAFYGAFAAKVTIVRLRRFPVVVLPLAGGTVFAVLLGAWYTSALWFFRLFGVEL